MRGGPDHAGAADRDLEAVTSVAVPAAELELQIIGQRVGRGAILLRKRPRMKHRTGAVQTADMHPLILGKVEKARAPDVIVVSHFWNVGGTLPLDQTVRTR